MVVISDLKKDLFEVQVLLAKAVNEGGDNRDKVIEAMSLINATGIFDKDE
jgi:hypothetical protein